MKGRTQKVLISVRGTQYHQADEQFRAGRLGTGASLQLVREHGNAHDRFAVLVKLAANRSNLGHVGRDYSQRYSELIDRGAIVSAVVKTAYRRPTGHLTIECVVEYRHDGEQSPSLSYVWHTNLERVAGVYEIRNLSNGCCYIGSASDVKARALQHERALHRHSHHNALLQRDFDRGGTSSFSFSLVRRCSTRKLRSEEAAELLRRRARGHGLYNATDDGQGLAPKPDPAYAPPATNLSAMPQQPITNSTPPITSVTPPSTSTVWIVVAAIALFLILLASM
jgi:HIRAN domain/GIY-YIG catalytic domain